MPRAAIVGATGLVGQQLLKLLLNDHRYEEIHCIGRNRADIDSPKLTQHILSLEGINTVKIDGGIDHAFCTLGTTIDRAKNKKNFVKVDQDYVFAFAGWAVANGANTMAVNSSVGADPRSLNFYLNTKGKMEQSVSHAGFSSLVFVRPSLLVPTGRKDHRFGEELSYWILKLFGWLLMGKARRYRPVKPADVARAMLNAALEQKPGTQIIESEDIPRWSAK